MFRIVREEIILKRRNSLQPSEYFAYGLDDPNRPWEEKLEFVGGTWGRLLWHHFTPLKYHCLYKNKLIFKQFFGGLGFPVARLYGVYDPVFGRTAEGAPLCNAQDIGAWMQKTGIASAVFKPVESAEGRMVFVMKAKKPGCPNVFIGMDGQEYTPEKLHEMLNDPSALRVAYPDQTPKRTFLVEERLCPHPEIVEITASETLCCLRLVTLLTSRNTVEIIGTYFKVQPEDISADNVGAGELLVYVDPDTGRLGEGVFYDDHDPTPYRKHPRGGHSFYGRTLPCFQESLETVRKAALAVPMARTIGWDIAMTTRGVCLVEGNASWGMSSVQFVANKGLFTPIVRKVYREIEGTQRLSSEEKVRAAKVMGFRQ